MIVEDVVFSKKFYIEARDPYTLGFKIRDSFSYIGKVIEKKNNYETDGPRHRSRLSFDIIRKIDEFTSLKVVFNIQGEQYNDRGTMGVEVSGIIFSNIRDERFFSKTFSEFYVKKLFPTFKKNMDDILKEISDHIEERMNKIESIERLKI